MADPIWKDKIIPLHPMQVAQFRIRNNDTGEVIYQGKAQTRPNEANVKLTINDICADYIRSHLPVWGKAFDTTAFTRTFQVQQWTGSSWGNIGSVEFLWDWSYDSSYLASRDGYSFPIRDILDRRQFLVLTTASTSASIPVQVFSSSSSSIFRYATIRRITSFNTDIETQYALFEMMPTLGTGVYDLSVETGPIHHINAGTLASEKRSFTVDFSLCHNYVLYYVNAYGGWDSLLLMGRVTETDNYTRHEHSMEYDNQYVESRGRTNFANEIDKRYTMQTGWIDELGASRMHNLLGSTHILLHNLISGEIRPIVLTNAECPYKTYGGEGNRLINYTLEARLAQDRIRR